MAAKFTVKMVLLSLVDIHMDRNVRIQSVESYDSPQMRESLAEIGQTTTAKLLFFKDTGRYEPIQGNRRVYNMQILAKEGVIDPKTVKRLPDGNLEKDADGKPVGGKPFETIYAEVYENLSEVERVEMLVDQGNTRGLNREEGFIAAEALFRIGKTEKEVVSSLFNMLQNHYPPSRSIKKIEEDKGQDALEYYRGIIQTYKAAYLSPIVARDAWATKLRDKLQYPLKKEMTDGLAIYKKAQDSDRTGKLSRSNPGPEFTAYWDGLMAKHKEALTNGKPKARSSAMMNHVQVAEKPLESRILKAFRFIVLRSIPEDQLPVLDLGVSRLETGVIDAKALELILDDVFNKLSTTDAPATDAPAAPATEGDTKAA